MNRVPGPCRIKHTTACSLLLFFRFPRSPVAFFNTSNFICVSGVRVGVTVGVCMYVGVRDHGCVGTCMWRPEGDVTEHKGGVMMI